MNNKYVQQFKKGSLEMILLCLIGRKETYGYESNGLQGATSGIKKQVV